MSLVQRFEIARGRTSELDKTGTGTAAVTTFDTDGIIDPTNPTSPHAGNLDPMKQARIKIVNPWKLLNENDDTTYNLFRGYVETWGDFEVDQSGNWIEGNIGLVDALALFAELRMMPTVHGHTPPAGQADVYFEGGPNGYSAGTFVHVDERIVKILDDIGWPGTGLSRDGVLRDVFSGNVRVLEQIYARADQAVTALDDAADAETPSVSNRFITKDGVFAFRGRFARFFPDNPGYGIGHWYLGGTPQAEADPENVVVISRLPGFRRSAQDVYNAALVLPSGADDADVPGNLVEDSTSIAAFGYRSRHIPDLLTYQGHNDDLSTTTAIEETKKFAQYEVGNRKDPKTRIGLIEIVALDPRHPLAQAQWAFLCGVELSDLISLETTHPGGGGFDEDFFVEGIHYVCTPAPPPKYYDLVCTLDVSPRSLFDYNPFGEIDIGVS